MTIKQIMQEYIPVQVSPDQMDLHTQTGISCGASVHEPPFLQGLSEHALTGTVQQIKSK